MARNGVYRGWQIICPNREYPWWVAEKAGVGELSAVTKAALVWAINHAEDDE